MLLTRLRCFLFCVLLVLPAAIVVGKGNGPDVVPGELIVKIRSEKALRELNQSSSMALHRVTRLLNAYRLKSMHTEWNNAYDHLAMKVLARHNKPSSTLDEVKNDLSRIYRVHYDAKTDPHILARKLARLPDVEYAEPVYIRHVTAIPNDTLYNYESAYLASQNFPNAWDVSKGDTSVVIAIIDTGVDYNHPDLKNKMWRNLAEEYGKPGVDDDGNGFVDDSIGWDFWESGDISAPVQDNNPIGEYSDHGTHVAGIATAQTNNTTGIAGTGYNCRFMAVKVGGTQAHPNDIGFGFEGIKYAMLNGADVINCSWGGLGGSKAEQDIINQATKLGVVVVCAAGNDNSNEAFFPASYHHVLSVGSVGTSSTTGFNLKSNFSDYGPHIDVMATGYGIYSTVFNNGYATKSGTSMATPVVSGLAGLIKALHPGWSAYRIESQIRATATNIDSYNSGYDYQLGHGRIDAYKALTDTTPGLAVVNYSFVNSGGQKLIPGEQGTLKIFVTNYNTATKNAQFSLSTSQPNITISSPTNPPTVIATGDTAEVDFPVSFGTNYDLSTVPMFRLDMSDNTYGYSDFHFISYDKLLYDVTEANNIQTSLSSDGTIAYQNPYDSFAPGGVGFNIWDPNTGAFSGNYLFSSGLMIMANDSLLADEVRSADSVDHGFKPENVFEATTPGIVSATDGSGRFNTLNTTNFPHFEVHLRTYQFTDPSINKTLFIKYTITNKSLTQATNVYVGLHNDWDLGQAINNTGLLQSDSLLYVYDTVDQNEPYVAVAQLGNVSSNLAINNSYTGPMSRFHFGIYYDPTNPAYDGYTQEEKRNSLVAGDSITTLSNTDVSVATASGPYTINRDDSIVVGFVYAYGNTLSDLQNQVEAARAKKVFTVTNPTIITGVEKTKSEIPTETRLVGNYPNPFNPTTIIQYDLSKSGNVSIAVYNLLGQKVTTLVDRFQRAGSYQVRFDGQNMSSGIYLIVLKTANHWQTRKMTLLK